MKHRKKASRIRNVATKVPKKVPRHFSRGKPSSSELSRMLQTPEHNADQSDSAQWDFEQSTASTHYNHSAQCDSEHSSMSGHQSESDGSSGYKSQRTVQSGCNTSPSWHDDDSNQKEKLAEDRSAPCGASGGPMDMATEDFPNSSNQISINLEQDVFTVPEDGNSTHVQLTILQAAPVDIPPGVSTQVVANLTVHH